MMMDIERFKRLPLLGILRGAELDSIEPLIETVIASGLRTIEITMNTRDAAELIKKTVRLSRKVDGFAVGAGTVIDLKSLKGALDAGATFIVMPVLIKDIVSYCVKNKIPVFPGAFSPQEIYDAWTSGATMVKVFPSGLLGPEYFREIKGPFDKIELLACGGVTPENIKRYFAFGASAAAFGASVFKKEWLANRDFESIGCRIKEYLSAIKS